MSEGSRDLTIRLRVDRSQAEAAVRAEIAQLRKLEQAYQGAMAKRGQAARKNGTDSVETARRTAREEVKLAEKSVAETLRVKEREAKQAKQLAERAMRETTQLAQKSVKDRESLERRAAKERERLDLERAKLEQRIQSQEEKRLQQWFARKSRMAERDQARHSALNERRIRRERAMELRRIREVEQAERRAAARAKRAADEKLASSRRHREQLAGTIKTFFGLGSAATLVLNQVRAMEDSMQAQIDLQDRLLDKYYERRLALSEIAAMEDQLAGNERSKEMGRFQASTGMALGEAVAFQEAFQGSGAQFSESIGESEFKQYMQAIGQLTKISGIDSNTMGDLAGGVLGFRDFGQFGDQASENAMAEFYQSLKILQAGTGDNAQLGRQLRMVSSLIGEEGKGVFQSGAEAASVVSTMAEVSPRWARTLTAGSIEALYATEGDEAEVLKSAGVEQDDNYFARGRKVAEYVQAQSAASNLTIDQTLRGMYSTKIMRDAVQALTVQGFQKDVIAKRMEYGKQFGVGSGEKEIMKAMMDPGSAIGREMALRAGEQKGIDAVEELALGETLRKQARLDLEAERAKGKAPFRDSRDFFWNRYAELAPLTGLRVNEWVNGRSVAADAWGAPGTRGETTESVAATASRLLPNWMESFQNVIHSVPDTKDTREVETVLRGLEEKARMLGIDYSASAGMKRFASGSLYFGQGGGMGDRVMSQGMTATHDINRFLTSEAELFTNMAGGMNPLTMEQIAATRLGREPASEAEMAAVLREILAELKAQAAGQNKPTNNPAPAPRSATPPGVPMAF